MPEIAFRNPSNSVLSIMSNSAHVALSQYPLSFVLLLVGADNVPGGAVGRVAGDGRRQHPAAATRPRPQDRRRSDVPERHQ